MTHPALDDLGTLATWLADNLTELRQLPAANEAYDDITAAIRNTTHTIDTPPNRTTIPVGPCPEPDCTGHVRAYIPHDTPAHMTCNGQARHRWEPHQWARTGRRIRQMMAIHGYRRTSA